ncbi:MAG: hypothetical protein C5B53_07515 [Candidatus Melainabacteria bacterium]|nr:MAG: hypothetical protein C5B53_07515 [Candidatus Melainabacteria bacterium]
MNRKDEIKRFWWVPCLLALLAGLLGQTSASALIADYTPLNQSDLRSKFKLKLVANGEDLKKGKELSVSGCRLKLKSETDLEISGKDAEGKSFVVVTPFSGLGTTIFSGDLDNNGVMDIVVIGVTGGCGYAPPRTFDSILFDEKRRPVLWGVESYAYGDENPSCCDLIRLKGDPRAVMVVESIVYHSVGEKDYSYWRTLLFRAENGGWRLLPSYRGQAMPLMVRFRFKSNHQLAKVIPSDIRSFQDASTFAPSGRGMKEVTIEHLKTDSEGNIESLDFGGGPVPNNSANDWYYGSTVYCEGDPLQVVSYNTGLAGEFLKDAANRKTRIKIPANMRPGCLPPAIWLSR